MRRPVLIILGLFLFVVALSGYVLLSVSGDLTTVKEMMSDDATDLKPADLDRARILLTRSSDRLRAPTARLLRMLPIMRQNLDALGGMADAGVPVVDAAERLHRRLRALEEEGLTRGKRIDVGAIGTLRAPLEDQLQAVEALETTAASHLGPWLLPPIWEESKDVEIGAGRIAADLGGALDAFELLPEFLGMNEPRRYLVLLMNNAELRGAGGVLTGVGTLQVDAGRVSLGRFQDVHQLRDDPPERVSAPADFRRRFSQYKADTTLWLNTTFSPDVPDVALVASRLYEKNTGVATDGAVLIDPVAIARLTPEDWSMSLPRYDRTLDRGDIDDFIFSDGYSLFADQDLRRDTILRLGRDAFEAMVSGGLGADALGDLGGLAGGGHIRITSFDDQEQDALHHLGLSGDLTPPGEPADAIMVTAQNLGDGDGQGTKLDHWARREISMSCRVTNEELGCDVATTIENDAPRRLPDYVAGDGILRSYIETYIPGGAELDGVTRDGSPEEFRTEEDEGRLAIGTYVELERGEATTIEVGFTARREAGSFRLVVQSQPLTRAAKIEARLAVPEDWRLSGPGPATGGRISFDGRLDRPLTFEATPLDPPGLAGAWRALRDFWRRPLFGG